jgi:predicted DNA-binding transcriptional regulator AlpA
MAHPALFTARPSPIASATTTDLCAILRVSPQTIRRMERDGRLPAPVRIGRKKVWPTEVVAALLLKASKEGEVQA